MTARGKSWETKLEVWHDGYRRDGRAVVWKTHPGVTVVRGKAVFTSAGPPDFIGVSGERSFVFDAKETAKDVLYCSQLKRHQAMDLEATVKHGGSAFLCVRANGRQCVIPWWPDVSARYWGDAKTFDMARAWDFGDDGWLDLVRILM